MTVPRSPDSGVFLRHRRGSPPVDLEGNNVEGALVDAAKGLAADEALEALDPERELAMSGFRPQSRHWVASRICCKSADGAVSLARVGSVATPLPPLLPLVA